MERQKPTNSVRNNDEFSQALIESYGRWMGGAGFGRHLYQEETYPELQKKGGEDDFSKKDPKANAGSPDPIVDLRTGSGVKQSHGATIKYTNVVAKEEKEEKEEKEGADKKSEAKFHTKLDKIVHKTFGSSPEEKKMKKETIEFELNGEIYIFEKKNDAGKEQGADGKACWKGYKYAGTENGKDNCVKAGDQLQHDGEDLQEKSVSKSQQRFMGMVHAKKKGEMKGGSEEVKKAASSMTGKEAEKFASTKHKGLPEKKKMKEGLDPIGKEDKDTDNDGDHDKSDKYLAARRKKVSKVISVKNKMREHAEICKEIEEEKK